jgi:hypothetical protein
VGRRRRKSEQGTPGYQLNWTLYSPPSPLNLSDRVGHMQIVHHSIHGLEFVILGGPGTNPP